MTRKRRTAQAVTPPPVETMTERKTCRNTKPRRKHKIKEIEALMRHAESLDWWFRDSKESHYRGYCGCVEKHMLSVPSSPSDYRSITNLVAQFRRSSCWVEPNR